MEKKDILYIKFNSYVKKSMYYTRLNYLKKELYLETEPLKDDVLSDPMNEEEQTLNKLLIQDLLDKASLNSIDKYIILSYYYFNKTDKEIGEVLQLTKQAIHYRRKKSLKDLKDAYYLL